MQCRLLIVVVGWGELVGAAVGGGAGVVVEPGRPRVVAVVVDEARVDVGFEPPDGADVGLDVLPVVDGERFADTRLVELPEPHAATSVSAAAASTVRIPAHSARLLMLVDCAGRVPSSQPRLGKGSVIEPVSAVADALVRVVTWTIGRTLGRPTT